MFSIKKLLGLTEYYSELDQFLKHYDREHPRLSASQLQEATKYQRIYRLRDHAVSEAPSSTVWEDF